jgi:hypothetical protein
MANQIHHGILMGQRLDMLCDAFSNMSIGRRCPNCEQIFVMPAKKNAQDGDATYDAIE